MAEMFWLTAHDHVQPLGTLQSRQMDITNNQHDIRV